MKIETVSSWWPLCLLALTGAAFADAEPYSFGVSEEVQHQSNVTRTADAQRQGDWISTTELNAAVNQAIGRNQFVASGEVDLNRYKDRNDKDLNATTYDVNAAFNWNTINDLSGSIGGDSRRRQYFYGFDGDVPPTATSPAIPFTRLAHNLETDNHVFSNVQLGGLARWTIFAGVDANQRNYSADTFSALEERQWSAHGGTSYATTPDLSFGVTGNITHGLYPHFVIGDQHDDFDQKSLDLTTKWQASGVSLLNASLGYTHANYTGQNGMSYLNGSLNWTWTPPSHFSVLLGLSRDSDSDTAAFGSLVNSNNLSGRSINNTAHVAVTYEVTAKTSLVANGQYTQRRYSNDFVPTATASGVSPVGSSIDGTNRTWLIGLNAHFKPTRTTDLGCGVSREVRTSDESLLSVTPSYSDNIVQCTAAISFD